MSQEHAAAATRKPHVLPIKIYAGVLIGLLILSFITVKVSYFDFGVMNLVVAMVIATAKAGLVLLFFMHLKYDEKFNAIVFASSLAFLGIFLVFTLADTVERGRVDPIEADVIELVPDRPELGEGGHGEETGEHSEGEGEAHSPEGDASRDSEETPSEEPVTDDGEGAEDPGDDH